MSTNNYSLFRHPGAFTLESGEQLHGYQLAYHTYGRLNERRDNAVWIFHALTANSDPLDWWPGLVGTGKLFDPAKYFIVCVNMPGSCYGSTGPLEKKPRGSMPYYHGFPRFTIHDMIKAYQPLRDALGIQKIRIGIGGSMGGQQLLEWAVTEPWAFDYIIPIATNAWHSAWGKAFNASQRWCIEADASWKSNTPGAGLEGMKIARSIALLSYRHYDAYAQAQSDEGPALQTAYKAASYQQYQGEKLARRFNAFSYYRLSQSMDSHHIGRRYGGAAAALQRISAKTLVIGLQSDILFPLSEQQYLAQHIPGARFASIGSAYGHDGFLLEFDAIEKEIVKFFDAHPPVAVDNDQDWFSPYSFK